MTAIKLIEFGLDVFCSDIDTVFLRDPTTYFQLYPEADLLVSSDKTRTDLAPGDIGLENADAIHGGMNVGLIFFRQSKNATRFLTDWVDALSKEFLTK